jgi:hypothetical protein
MYSPALPERDCGLAVIASASAALELRSRRGRSAGRVLDVVSELGGRDLGGGLARISHSGYRGRQSDRPRE